MRNTATNVSYNDPDHYLRACSLSTYYDNKSKCAKGTGANGMNRVKSGVYVSRTWLHPDRSALLL